MNKHHDINLNIHYTAPDEIWCRIRKVYENMPYWSGDNPLPCWKGNGIDLTASVESSGIQISGKMPEDIWEDWYEKLKDELTKALGYEIGEPEDGFYFKYWEPFVKNYSDMKSMDRKEIIFNDYAVFQLDSFEKIERDINVKPPYFSFMSEYMELRIVFNETGLFANQKNRKCFEEMRRKLCEMGYRSRDLS